jgi:hypothetical protein
MEKNAEKQMPGVLAGFRLSCRSRSSIFKYQFLSGPVRKPTARSRFSAADHPYETEKLLKISSRPLLELPETFETLVPPDERSIFSESSPKLSPPKTVSTMAHFLKIRDTK